MAVHKVHDRWELPGAAEGGQVPLEGGGAAAGALQRLLHLPPRQARLAAYLLAAAALGVALMGLPGLLQPPRPGQPEGRLQPGGGSAHVPAGTLSPPVPAEPAEGGRDLAREIEAALNLVEGVGSVKVFIAYESGPQRMLAFNETREERTVPPSDGARAGGAALERRVTRQAVIVRDADGRRELPVVTAERFPVVKGVLVVADGAKDPSVRLAILRAVSAALGVPPHRIVVEPKRR